MKFCIAGKTGAGNTNFAQRVSILYPEEKFIDISYCNLEEHNEALTKCDGVIITVNLMEGPMPGTRYAITDCKNSARKIVGFCLTHLDEFDAQSKYGPHIKELIEVETRELASCYGYNDDKIPAVKIALIAGSNGELKNFMDAVSEYCK